MTADVLVTIKSWQLHAGHGINVTAMLMGTTEMIAVIAAKAE